MGVYRTRSIYKTPGVYRSGVYASGLYGPEDTVTIGGRTYETVKIGDQVWLAENLDFVFDGLVVGQGASSSEPRANYYANDEGTYGWSGLKYGLLYNWIAVKYLEDHKSELMPGWHVPTDADFNALFNAVGGTAVAGKKLKSTTGWSSGNGDGSYGFEAFPAGSQDSGSFGYKGRYTGFWTSTEHSASTAANYNFNTTSTTYMYNNDKSYCCSLRLVKDSPVPLLGGPLLGSPNTEATDGE